MRTFDIVDNGGDLWYNFDMNNVRSVPNENNDDGIIISSASNVFYLCGYDCGGDGTIVSSNGKTVLFTDRRYTEEAARRVNAEVEVRDGGLPEIAAFFRENGAKRISFEAEAVSCAEYTRLKDAISGVEFVPTVGAVEKLRAVKSSRELARIADAQKITDKVFEEILPLIKEGITEYELAAKLEYAIRSKGAELAFDSIVAFGTNGSSPHAHRSEAVLKKGDLVTMDFGAKLDGYCSDMTRTVACGYVNDAQRSAYGAVLEANTLCVAKIRAGMTCREADSLARERLKIHGLDGYFVHSLGHGVGIDIHEAPYLSQRSDEVLTEGNVVTVEPGVYLEGLFGIRIEDMVVVKDGCCIDLTGSDKDLIIL